MASNLRIFFGSTVSGQLTLQLIWIVDYLLYSYGLITNKIKKTLWLIIELKIKKIKLSTDFKKHYSSSLFRE